MTPTSTSGLEDVVVADTHISLVDGQAGRLVVAGHDVEALARTATFEDVCGLLWEGRLPDPAGREEIREGLARGRAGAHERLELVVPALVTSVGMDALREATALLAPGSDGGEPSPAEITAAVGVAAAAWFHVQARRRPPPPDPSRSHAADILGMMLGSEPPQAAVRGLEAYMVTVAEHGMNASTFVARIVASTGSDLASAVVAAIGALKGPLHGGAPGPVLDMLDAIGVPERAAPWIEAELVAGRRIMGMGHRIYRVRDPRAAVFERALSDLAASGVSTPRLALARAVETEAERQLAARHPGRPLHANVEFYTAVLLEAVGIDRRLFSPTFALARVVGWCAHVMEQRRTGRLIRPAARYVGPLPSA